MEYDRTEMPARYDAGRSYSPDVLRFWLDTIADAIPDRNVRTILDLGCGTGRYSAALAERFDADVEAIDPSEKMLAEAARKPFHPRVRYQRASGEELPFGERSIDLVFMSMVFHHLSDPHRVAGECHRVLRPGGSVCLRAGTRERIPGYPYVPFFPRSAAIFEAMVQPAEEIVSVFARGGFELLRHLLVGSRVAANWIEFAEKLAHRADSVLAQLPDMEFDSGMNALRRYARSQPIDLPVVEQVDLFIFQRP